MITSLRYQRFRTGILLAVAAILLTSSPLLAESDLDPVVADVLEMLEASVDEGVILQWLESTDRRPADIGAEPVPAVAPGDRPALATVHPISNQGTDAPSSKPPDTPRGTWLFGGNPMASSSSVTSPSTGTHSLFVPD